MSSTKKKGAAPSALELVAIREWRMWGTGYAMHTRCDGCGEQKMCRGPKRRKMLCLECFDSGEFT